MLWHYLCLPLSTDISIDNKYHRMSEILFVLNDGVYPYKTGGMEIFNYYLIKSLSSIYDVRYIASHPIEESRALFIKSWKIRPQKIFAPLRLLVYCLFHPNIKNILLSYSEAHWTVWFLYALTIKFLKLNSVTVIHHGKQNPDDHFKAYNFFFHTNKHIVAVSDDIKSNYDSAFGITCRVIFPLVPFSFAKETRDIYRSKYDIPADSNVICMIGSLKMMKNPDTLIDAIVSFTEEEKTRFKPMAVFAGDGDMKTYLQTKAKECNISSYVKFLGNIPKQCVNEIMSLSDIFLIASDFEGTSVSLLEAMFNSKPIIISRAPGLEDMIEENLEGLAFTTRDSLELKSCIIKMLSDPELREKLSMAAHCKYLNKYNYSDVIASYSSLF